ncbi:Asp23/Gls24 family envelope stress response protein [Deinococcus marmoris]|uniref:Asp23/Gls24 family envelope stress response protein n=1 Tax=Deinococcus marmoris TaxID=249408 RepID=UPI0004968358|nr:Asp23/Gls24 family envelope stress response protein [Deinococcus marmoris]
MTGSITISEAALASLIGLTAHEIPGVVGMAPANLKEGISRVLGRANVSDGVVIGKEKGGDTYTADLYIVAAYGVSIPTVARNIVERVEHTVKTLAGIELSATRVHAVGVQRA